MKGLFHSEETAMYSTDHHCQVSRQDLEYLRFDLERTIQDLRSLVDRLDGRLDAIREDISSMWDAIEKD